MNRFFRTCSRYWDLCRQIVDKQQRQQPQPHLLDLVHLLDPVREVRLIDEGQQHWEQDVIPNGLNMSDVLQEVIDNVDTPAQLVWFGRDLFVTKFSDDYLADNVNFVKLFCVEVGAVHLLVCARTPTLATHSLENRIFPLLSAQSSHDMVWIVQDPVSAQDGMIIPLTSKTLTFLVTMLNKN